MAKITIEGVSINYQLLSPHPPEARRDEPCLVYLHGLVMDNLSSGYFTFAQTLSESHTLLLYDLRGHGKSDVAHRGYRVSDHAEELFKLLSALALEGPLHLIGSSFGGSIAMECAQRYPERVRSVVLLDGHPHSSGFLTQLGADLSAPPDHQRALIAHHFQHWFSRDVPRKRDRLAKRAKALIEETTLIADLQESATARAEGAALSLPPTLALYGENSDALSLAQEALSQHPQVTWRLYAGRSHALLWEETEAVCSALKAWFERR